MAIERQTVWGNLVIIDTFLGGIGAGIFPVSVILYFLTEMRETAIIGMLLGPILVIAGLICLLLEVGSRSPLKIYRVLLFPGLLTSWMSRGALIQILYIIFGLGYVVPAFWLDRWLESVGGLVTAIIACILALIIAAYHGLLLSQARAIPLWSCSVLPLLSFFTALSTGLGLMLLISLAYINANIEKVFSILGIAGGAFIVGELISIWSLLSLRPNLTYSESIKRLMKPMSVVIACLILPLILLVYGLSPYGITHLVWISAFSGILLLVGGFIIRYSIIRAGHYYSLQIPLPR